MGIRTPNPPSSELCTRIINGGYCKVFKTTSLLTISYVRVQSGAAGDGTSNNIITFTNPDNTTCELRLPTLFQTVSSGQTWVTFNLPLNYKSFTFTSASDPGQAP